MAESSAALHRSILVVDDHPDVCDFMRVALESAGYEVRTTLQGVHALALLRERRADLLITDIFMPGQGGFETMWRCKSEFPGTRIVVMSAGGETGMKEAFLSTASLVGVAATLPKPFSAPELLSTVRRALQA